MSKIKEAIYNAEQEIAKWEQKEFVDYRDQDITESFNTAFQTFKKKYPLAQFKLWFAERQEIKKEKGLFKWGGQYVPDYAHRTAQEKFEDERERQFTSYQD